MRKSGRTSRLLEHAKHTLFDRFVYSVAAFCWVASFYLLYLTYKPFHSDTGWVYFILGVSTLVEVYSTFYKSFNHLLGKALSND